MAPHQREPSIEQTTEYDEFIKNLEEFHEKRGTPFDAQPKVGTTRVDLLRLYKRVTEEGGYDEVSDTRKHKLAWRQIGIEFKLGVQNYATLAFSLKTVYYKNLAAYEIADYHQKDPPPREILEDVSARGGNILSRTTDNFQRPISRDELLANGLDNTASEDDDGKSPIEDKMDVDDPSGAGARVTRGLRQAPPQRVPFQSDLSSGRQSRQATVATNSPAPQSNPRLMANGNYTSNALSGPLADYEPKSYIPLTLRPVPTPANNPEAFKASQRATQRPDATTRQGKHGQSINGIMLPGTGFTGNNIYLRTLLSLQSGVIEEEEYALHHLVKISHERGDKYRFDNFGGLAEALINKVLQIGSLFYDVRWRIAYHEEEYTSDIEALDGLNGTANILQRIRSLRVLDDEDRMETEDSSRQLHLVNEAGLVLRNMIMLEANADFISRHPSMRDLIIILLNLPYYPRTIEIQNYGLEIAEQLTRYYSLAPEDPMFESLIKKAHSQDRGIILTSLRAIFRIGLNLDQVRPLELPTPLLRRVCDLLLIEDEPIRAVCLDVLYRFITSPNNVEILLGHDDIGGLVKQLVRLLLKGARFEDRKETPKQLPKNSQTKEPFESLPIPSISSDLIEQLLGYDEPERSSQWLRSCFIEDPQGEITQLELWKAYQIPFAPYGNQRPLLPAKDFITNVSTTFLGASAQVTSDPTGPRFVIKGITPRKVPVDPKGRAYMRCLWRLDTSDEGECGQFALWPKYMWEHIVSAHLGLSKDSEGKFNLNGSNSSSASASVEPQPAQQNGHTPRTNRYACRWSNCNRYPNPTESAFTLGMHVKTHLPDATSGAYQRSKHNKTIPTRDKEDHTDNPSDAFQNQIPWPVQNTPIDDRNDAAGLPHTAAIILRALARNIPKTSAAARVDEENERIRSTNGTSRFNAGAHSPKGSASPESGRDASRSKPNRAATGEGSLVWRIFAPVRDQLFFVMAYNWSLREYLPEVVGCIERGT